MGEGGGEGEGEGEGEVVGTVACWYPWEEMGGKRELEPRE